MSASISTTSEILVVSIETDGGSYRVKPKAGFQMSNGVLLQCHTDRRLVTLLV